MDGCRRARELPNLSLEDALQLVHLYAEKQSPKFEKAAVRWLERYLVESSPKLEPFAEITASLAGQKNRAVPPSDVPASSDLHAN